MIKTIILYSFGALFFTQLAQATIADDAENILQRLRLVTMEALNGAYDKQLQIANDVDAAALDTKAAALKTVKEDSFCQQVLAGDLDACVNDAATEIINELHKKNFDYIDLCLKTIYDNQKAIIVCGREDAKCLGEVIDEITIKLDEIPDFVTTAIQETRVDADKQIEVIKSCADAAVKKARSC